jgi:hypothetical protein
MELVNSPRPTSERLAVASRSYTNEGVWLAIAFLARAIA